MTIFDTQEKPVINAHFNENTIGKGLEPIVKYSMVMWV